ncbi:MAG: hypothetical protein A2365_02425 [Candidatus Nealsonbacteria bacterium RIFOXYB1_FULL_40_15]|uniref:Uncharacterized protein n=2 Tax=Candidatus Nealsoniibacteriota TaxID=1817911 RepID=A0A1G2EPA6_9BACT|nr:MAG: hypothetical protein A2365_02425 [Candidatus Nealsonbacteria bacterium RIFOXYB1_FULL_40_15]OGZ27644.1 MAG: hypothetical protein A2427_02750 [Candidatus Nealsonbacteria bacterium RIFOXYC1_FULL_40_7]OGZ28688.1 MAG: hypothetical protein A2562_00555 [Candidatus Nealsonbacteria bacterium RIFOXYD1_FULL_39_11]
MVDVEKWEKMPLSVQMGNIGSEINRVIHWEKLGKKEEKENALWRALELLDLTINQTKSWELLRLREMICDKFLGENSYNISSDFFKNYFLQFYLIGKGLNPSGK